MRKVIQLTPVFVKEGSHANCDFIQYVALCDDGTMWIIGDPYPRNHWQQLPPIPQSEPEGGDK